MEITKQHLKQIIEEVKKDSFILNEAEMHIDPDMTRREMRRVLKSHGFKPMRPPHWERQASPKYGAPLPHSHWLRKEYRAWYAAQRCKKKGLKKNPHGPGCLELPYEEQGPPWGGPPKDPLQSYDPEYHTAEDEPLEPGRIVVPKEVVRSLFDRFMDALDRHEETWDDWTNFDKRPAFQKLQYLIRAAEKGCTDPGGWCGNNPWAGYDFLQGQGHKIFRLLGRAGGPSAVRGFSGAHRGQRVVPDAHPAMGIVRAPSTSGEQMPIGPGGHEPDFRAAEALLKKLLLFRRHVVQPGGGEYGDAARSMPSSAEEFEELRENKITIKTIS